MNGATLYNYYASKDALYEAVLERGMRPLKELLERFASGPHEAENISRLVTGVMQHLAQHPHLPQLIYLETIAQVLTDTTWDEEVPERVKVPH